MSNDNLPVQKSEILFLYESTYSIPNGDPFTGEQRYDDETKKVLVSDVRIKRFIRDYFIATGADIFVVSDKSALETDEKLKGSGAALRMRALKGKYGQDAEVQRAKAKGKAEIDTLRLMQKCIDVRLFGGISTEEGDAVNLTGPVQFALLNPSLNKADLRIHQNTSVFSSSEEKSRGAIGTTTVVPYSLNQIHGWINPYSARHTGLSEADVKEMFKALWESVNNANTRTKSNQNSLLLLQVVYAEPTKKLYGVDRFIKLEPKEKRDEQIRNSDDYSLDFSRLKEAVNSPVVSAVNFYTEKKELRDELNNASKFVEMSL
ncbi:MAG TPA: type I-B CRISPR-associated protein Cas7/Csh2 [Blastocatellia bacterium]|nr:type I-B CRISPR-associated protein Cas7/Csh2 [Blastocatellia bacterium]